VEPFKLVEVPSSMPARDVHLMCAGAHGVMMKVGHIWPAMAMPTLLKIPQGFSLMHACVHVCMYVCMCIHEW
jgi:hypothetical protein